MERRIPSQILVKPAGPDCNLRCRYCFYDKKQELFPNGQHRMSDDVLRLLTGQVTRAGAHQITFSWQGGEPTLMGLDFFKRIVEFQSEFAHPNQMITNCLQTNGLVLNDDWLEFLDQHQFLVGLSIDGPQHVHDRYRTNDRGDGSWTQVTKTARRLLDRGVDTNALIVLSDESAAHLREIWSTLKAIGLRHFQLIPCLELDPRNPSQWADYCVTPQHYGQILCEAFDLWLADFEDGVPGTFERWFEALMFSYVGFPPPLCTLQEVCGDGVVVEHNGNVYACDFFVEPEWQLGNILETDLTELINSERQHVFGVQKANVVDPCRQCRWLRFCRGGCPKDRLRSIDGTGLDPFCSAYRTFFDHANPHLERLANEWRSRQVYVRSR